MDPNVAMQVDLPMLLNTTPNTERRDECLLEANRLGNGEYEIAACLWPAYVGAAVGNQLGPFANDLAEFEAAFAAVKVSVNLMLVRKS
jgi:hypothetical protein